jgi:hypothetical protein
MIPPDAAGPQQPVHAARLIDLGNCGPVVEAHLNSLPAGRPGLLRHPASVGGAVARLDAAAIISAEQFEISRLR